MNMMDSGRWVRLWQASGARGDPLAVFEELAERYSESHRHYHNTRHIGECLGEYDSARSLVASAQDAVAVELAIWFHDAIYDTRAHDNEERSAELARRRLSEASADENLCASVGNLILATKAHDAALHPNAPLLVDVDLSILGQPQARFCEYETQIRREYDWVPEGIFDAKRAELLSQFLARQRIYATDHFFSKYERQARANLMSRG